MLDRRSIRKYEDKPVPENLIHDIVEIDAGDTYAYDEEAKKTQKEREEKAAERIFGLLPEEQGKLPGGIGGRNLRQEKHRKQNLRGPWTIFSR